MRTVLLTTAAIAISQAADLKIQGDDASVIFSSEKAYKATLTASCPQFADVHAKFITPAQVNFEATHVQVELGKVLKTCVDADLDQPCAAHTAEHPKLFSCEWTGARGASPVGPLPALRKLDKLDDVTLGVITYLECPLPTYDELVRIRADSWKGTAVELTLSVKFNNVELPFLANNQVSIDGLPGPPPTSPPPMPPAPISPPTPLPPPPPPPTPVCPYSNWKTGSACNPVHGSCSSSETGYWFLGISNGYACWWHTKNQGWNTGTSTNFYSLASHFALSTTGAGASWCHSRASALNCGGNACKSSSASYFQAGNVGAWGWCGGEPFQNGGSVCFPTSLAASDCEAGF